MSALRGRFRDVGTKSTDICCGVLPTPIVPLDERNLLVQSPRWLNYIELQPSAWAWPPFQALPSHVEPGYPSDWLRSPKGWCENRSDSVPKATATGWCFLSSGLLKLKFYIFEVAVCESQSYAFHSLLCLVLQCYRNSNYVINATCRSMLHVLRDQAPTTTSCNQRDLVIWPKAFVGNMSITRDSAAFSNTCSYHFTSLICLIHVWNLLNVQVSLPTQRRPEAPQTTERTLLAIFVCCKQMWFANQLIHKRKLRILLARTFGQRPWDRYKYHDIYIFPLHNMNHL